VVAKALRELSESEWGNALTDGLSWSPSQVSCLIRAPECSSERLPGSLTVKKGPAASMLLGHSRAAILQV